MAVVPKYANVQVQKFTLIESNYTVDPERDWNVLLVNITTNTIINLPNITTSRLVDGYYIWIKRIDSNPVTLTVFSNGSDTIDGEVSTLLSATEEICLIVKVSTTTWEYQKGFEYFVTSSRDINTISPSIPGSMVYNTNAGALDGIGLYVSDGIAWSIATGGLANTAGVIIGDGSILNPIQLQLGSPAGSIPQFDGVNWNLEPTNTAQIIYVDSLIGDDVNGYPYNPFRPYQTIDAALGAIIGAGLFGKILFYVRQGTYTANVRLITQSLTFETISWFFEPGTVINCTVTPFFWGQLGDVAINDFYVYGNATFVTTTNPIVNIINNFNTFYIEAFSFNTTSGTSISLLNTSGGVIKISNNLLISDGVPCSFSTGDGTIYATNIIGTTGCLSSVAVGVSNWKVYASYMFANTNTILSSTATSNMTINVQQIKANINVVNVTNGTLTLKATTMTSLQSGNSTIVLSGGTANMNISNIVTNNSYSLNLSGSAICNLTASQTQGINCTAGTPTLSANIGLLTNINIGGASSPVITLNIGTLQYSGGTAIALNSAGMPNIQAFIQNTIMSSANNIYNSAGSGTYTFEFQKITPGNTSPFIFAGTTNNSIKFSNLTGAFVSAPLFMCSGSSVNTIAGKNAVNSGYCLQLNTAYAGTTKWMVANANSSNQVCLLMDISGNPTLELRDAYLNSNYGQANPAGYCISVTGVGVPIIKAFNSVLVVNTTFPTSYTINTVNAINVLVYSKLLANVTVGGAVTFLVGSFVVNVNVS